MSYPTADHDLVLLDLNLPDGDGFAVCRAVRASPGGPLILMLTARDRLADRVRGLDEGADDHLVEPFALPELLARIRALLRREDGGTAVVAVGELRLDTARFEAFRGERRLPLTPKEFGVLHHLMTRPGRVVPAEELLEHVWDEHADPFTNTVRVTVGLPRRKVYRRGRAAHRDRHTPGLPAQGDTVRRPSLRPGRPRPPAFVRTIRFRPTVLYPGLLFVLTALVLGATYLAVERSGEAHPVSDRFRAKKYVNDVHTGEIDVVKLQEVEAAVNHETLANLRNFSFAVLGVLAVAGPAIGWILSGRALRPVRAISRTAADIQATDLSQRIR
ncbi:response regulator transcription factor [Streptomyces cadmiisoli]|uniref:response regulator transcription factor n=1 Tax=Streptomyces cadmiisoli TaxID=2184053 RepID=UPI0036523D23